MNLDHILPTFIAESGELLEGMEQTLLSLSHEPATPETINDIFRAAHTIKGSAGIFGFDSIVAFTHVMESVLDRAREGRVQFDPALVDLLLKCGDHIRRLVEAVQSNQGSADPALIAAGDPLCEALCKYCPDLVLHKSKSAPAAPAPTPAKATAATPQSNGADDAWLISLHCREDLLRNGTSPLSLIRYLRELGTITEVMTSLEDLPDFEEMDPESCYLHFEIALRSDKEREDIESVFEFVEDECTITILEPRSRITDYLRLIEELPDTEVRLGEMLVRCGTVTAEELDAALAAQLETGVQRLGDILVDRGLVHPDVVGAAVEKQNRIKAALKRMASTRDSAAAERLEKTATDGGTVRVDASKLDRLINLVGELITATAGANLTARLAQNPELVESTANLSELVEEVRDSALQLRMVRIGATFNRFQRVVHEVSRELGKDIVLKISGEDAELDKTVVEKLTDPLTHLVRNAMDHGIEAASVRKQNGKPERGTVSLNAFHDSGNIVIEVSDDGGGLRRERILAKAIERGLVDASQKIEDKDIFNLIFEPGFSTAEKVTNLSGRGVGMDVVKRNITALRGSISLDSSEGVGTTVTVRLPLTLAIIDGFLVGLGKAQYVVPLDQVDECVAVQFEPGTDYMNLRGEILPLLSLRNVFDLAGNDGQRQFAVVVRQGGRKIGLVVDELLGEFQTVIKPLGKMFSQLRGISGSTILGSGDIALILDTPALIEQANQFHRIHHASTQRPAAAHSSAALR